MLLRGLGWRWVVWILGLPCLLKVDMVLRLWDGILGLDAS